MDIKVKTRDHGRLVVNAEYASLLSLNKLDTADLLWQAETESIKEILKERGTGRLFLNQDQSVPPLECYLKRYRPVPIKEKLKNWICGKRAYFDAFHEWKAILAFHKYELPTMVPIAVAKHGHNSCLLTLGITDYIRASELLPSLCSTQHGNLRRTIVKKIAKLAGTMHRMGLAHQDFYLVHLFIRENENYKPYIIDLQRVIMQRRLAMRWRVKDLAQLLFSAAPVITKQDIDTFCNSYMKAAGISRQLGCKLARAVSRKAGRMAARHNRKNKKNACDSQIAIPDIKCT